MNAQSGDKIRSVYNTTAADYAADRIDELFKKPFDSLLLKEFARVNRDRGFCADFGCGPGQATKFLYDQGLKNIIGVDLSPAMIDTARKLFPEIKFDTGDLLDLSFGENPFWVIYSFLCDCAF